ncbi:enoyl-CoA hydratase-related protein [Rhodococcus sp. NPDC056960]|uniref:enoyl-CoA hydratase-related protein n=1 Tax=Rhodococcus TaxID=1827 RepID=UPI00363EF0DA
MSDYTNLRWTVDDTIATVWLTRPPVNAVSQDMYREICALFANPFQIDASVKVIVLAGEGRHFCAGNDLGEFATLSPENSDARMAEVRAAFFAIQDCPVPVIGAVQGAAFGTGLAILASCDFVVTAEDARIGTPEVGVGVMGGAKHLARLIPQPWVRWMYFTAQPLSGAQLVALGGAVQAVPREQVMKTAGEHARLIARHSGPILRMAKRSLNAIETMDLQPGYAFEQSLTGEISGHPDSREAVLATLEQRPPAYSSESRR